MNRTSRFHDEELSWAELRANEVDPHDMMVVAAVFFFGGRRKLYFCLFNLENQSRVKKNILKWPASKAETEKESRAKARQSHV